MYIYLKLTTLAYGTEGLHFSAFIAPAVVAVELTLGTAFAKKTS